MLIDRAAGPLLSWRPSRSGSVICEDVIRCVGGNKKHKELEFLVLLNCYVTPTAITKVGSLSSKLFDFVQTKQV